MTPLALFPATVSSVSAALLPLQGGCHLLDREAHGFCAEDQQLLCEPGLAWPDGSADGSAGWWSRGWGQGRDQGRGQGRGRGWGLFCVQCRIPFHRVMSRVHLSRVKRRPRWVWWVGVVGGELSCLVDNCGNFQYQVTSCLSLPHPSPCHTPHRYLPKTFPGQLSRSIYCVTSSSPPPPTPRLAHRGCLLSSQTMSLD